MLNTRLPNRNFVPRRKYGKLTKPADKPPVDNCSRCRAGKHCPIPEHHGYVTEANRKWGGPESVDKRGNKKNPARK